MLEIQCERRAVMASSSVHLYIYRHYFLDIMHWPFKPVTQETLVFALSVTNREPLTNNDEFNGSHQNFFVCLFVLFF